MGVASFATSASGRTYTEDDLALAVQLADRAALAIDNALIFGRERDRALILQRSLLPPGCPTQPASRRRRAICRRGSASRSVATGTT